MNPQRNHLLRSQAFASMTLSSLAHLSEELKVVNNSDMVIYRQRVLDAMGTIQDTLNGIDLALLETN